MLYSAQAGTSCLRLSQRIARHGWRAVLSCEHTRAHDTRRPSEHLPCQHAMPERFRVQMVVQAEEVKDIAATPPHVAVPARATRRARPIDPKRRGTIAPIGMVFPKGATAHAATVKPH